jgi:hypothetical protein
LPCGKFFRTGARRSHVFSAEKTGEPWAEGNL